MSGPRRLSDSIPRIAGGIFKQKYIMLGRLVTRWPEIVGADMADKAQPVKIRRAHSKNGAVMTSLDIAVSSADAMVLHYRKDLILERINQIFGEQLVGAIRFVPIAANSSRPMMHKRKPRLLTEPERDRVSSVLASLGDEVMASRLQSLGHAILQDGDGDYPSSLTSI